MNEDTIINRAIDAYFRFCRDHGVVFQQPALGLSTFDENVVTLENCGGVLAKYRWTGQRVAKVEHRVSA